MSFHVDHESAAGLRAAARNLLDLADRFDSRDSAQRLRLMAARYTAIADERENLPLSKAIVLRSRAAEIFRIVSENPEPQWQRAKALAERYLVEAAAIECRESAKLENRDPANRANNARV